jgi:hypothetical protein
MSVIFEKCHLFHNFIFFSSNMFFINQMLKLKYQHGHLKVNPYLSERSYKAPFFFQDVLLCFFDTAVT